MQAEGGRYFVHEPTAGHASWRFKELQELLSGATSAEGDLSQFQVRSPSGNGFAQQRLKTKSWMWNETTKR